jgi:hypothetical protein
MPIIVTVVPGTAVIGVILEMTGAGTNVNPERVAVPPGVITTTEPLAPVVIKAVICFSEIDEITAATPPKVADEAPNNPVPVIVIAIPGPAMVGEKPVIVGTGGIKTKPDKLSLPSGETTETSPLAPSSATIAVTFVGESMVKSVALMPPNRTSVTVERFVPVIITVCPGPALEGMKLVIVGAGIKLKPERVAVPPGVEMAIVPPALPGTTAVICVGETIVKLAAVAVPKLTAVAPVKFAPLIVIVAPGSPLCGEKLVIAGVGTYVNPAKLALPPGVTIVILPLAPPRPTTAVICVGELIV